MPLYSEDSLRVEGLKELAKALKALDPAIAKQLRLANKRAASVVAEDAAQRAPEKTGRLKKSIRALGQARSSTVAEGNAKVPYAGFVDFGGNIQPRGAIISRPFIKEGRILFPALQAKSPQVMAIYEAEINEIINKF